MNPPVSPIRLLYRLVSEGNIPFLNVILNVAIDRDLWNLTKTVQVVLVSLKLAGQLSWSWSVTLSPLLTMSSLYFLFLLVMIPQFLMSAGGRRPEDLK
jgi:hypothetical protein